MKDLIPFVKDDELEKLNQAFLEIQMPRPPYTLDKLVVNTKFTNEQKYAQCVLELSIAYDNLRIAGARSEIKEIEISEMNGEDKKVKPEKLIAQVELEQLTRARVGAYREFEYLYKMWKSFDKNYTREELNDAQETEYKCRIELQALQDKNACGRISQGNQEALRQIGSTVYPELDVIRSAETRFLENHNSTVSRVENSYLSEGNIKMIIAVATKDKDAELKCIQGLEFPSGIQIKIFNSFDRPVAENYNNIVQEAINDRADYLVTVEDDTFPQPDAIVKLFELLKANPMSAVGAWYPKKEVSRQGVHIILNNKNERTELKDDGLLHEVYTMAMGCSIYPVKMFTEIPYPWFTTTAILSQDSFFSQLAREKGYKLLVDTNIKCKHICRETGKVFGVFGNIEPQLMQIRSEFNKLLEVVKGKKLILEIGTALGGSLYNMMKVADDNAEFVSIDLPNGKFGGEFGQPSEETMNSWKKLNQELTVIKADSQSFITVEKVKQILNGRKFDFIFIDGDHSYEGVKGDYKIYEQFSDGEIAFHDIAEHTRVDVGVRKFWLELEGKKTEFIENEKQGWAGIGIIKK